MSRNYEEQKTATPEKIQAEADRVTYPPWYINPYEELTAENRGNPLPIISDPQAYNEYISFKAGQAITQEDMDRTIRDALKLMCPAYMPQYEHMIGQDNFPEWLVHCIENDNGQ